MIELSKENVRELTETLDRRIKDRLWKKILESLALTGIADNQQLIALTGLDRDKLRREMDKMAACASSYPPLFRLEEQKLTRPGITGRAPKVYFLDESGAAVLKAQGHPYLRPYQRSSPIAKTHDLAILDLWMSAHQSDLQAEIEKRLSFDSGQYLIPDLLVTLPGGEMVFYEIEQYARPEYMRRIMDGLQHRLAYFKSPDGHNCLPVVRTLFNLQPGSQYEKTLRRWREALRVLANEEGGELPFTWLAMPLREFLQRPDWDAIPSSGDWQDLTAEMFTTVDAQPTAGEEETPSRVAMPSDLVQRLPADDLLVLKAIWQLFDETQQLEDGAVYPVTTDEFFETMVFIYHPYQERWRLSEDSPWMPQASITMLREYLAMRPDLRQQLNKIIAQGEYSMRWNTGNILHRMQVVIDEFLAYFDLRSGGMLRAYPVPPSYDGCGPRTFNVVVEIRDTAFLLGGDDLVEPDNEAVSMARKALSWVLEALFKYPEKIGVRRQVFW